MYYYIVYLKMKVSEWLMVWSHGTEENLKTTELSKGTWYGKGWSDLFGLSFWCLKLYPTLVIEDITDLDKFIVW